MEKNDKKGISRRQFVSGLGASVALFSIVPRHVLGKGFIPPSDKLNIAAVGAGGKGYSNIIAAGSRKIQRL